MKRGAQRKRGGTSRLVPEELQPEYRRLAAVQRAVYDGAELGLSDRRWLADLLFAIMDDDEDVRDRFYRTVRGAPPSQDRAYWCALWIVAKRGARTVADVKEDAEAAWSMTTAQVKHAWDDDREQAEKMFSTSKNSAALCQRIERHRATYNKA